MGFIEDALKIICGLSQAKAYKVQLIAECIIFGTFFDDLLAAGIAKTYQREHNYVRRITWIVSLCVVIEHAPLWFGC